ncbi:MAG: hypothetical protein R3F42_16220 [Pseudomonadota bacterium]
MRHLVYLLLILNVAYFGWNLFAAGTPEQQQRELPPLPASAKPLVTLQEMQQHSAAVLEQDADGVDALTRTDPPGAGGTAVCQRLGPFLAEADARAVAAQLDRHGLEPRQRVSADRQESSYWVYLPSMTRAAAMEIARQLDAQGDHEYYIGKDNFISLGTFRDSARAEIRQRQLQEMGLDAMLEPRHATRDSYWLEFRGRHEAAPIVAEVMDRYPGLLLQPMACL